MAKKRKTAKKTAISRARKTVRKAKTRVKSAAAPHKSNVSYRLLETEINRLSDLLQTVKQKSALVRRSLAYLEKEQRKVKKQLSHARSFLMRLKNKGVKAFQNFSAEDLYQQVKDEFNRLSKRWSS
jgi:cob(I)alamin adenosyltransferase